MDNQKTPTRVKDLSSDYGTKYSGEYLYFGVVFEALNPPTLSEISRDIISLLSVLPPTTRLAVVCPNARELHARLGGSFDVDFQDGGLDNKKVIWKCYYFKSVPIPPEGIVYKYVRRVLPPEQRKRISIRPNVGFQPNLNLPGDHRIVPPGMSPMTMRPTYRGPAPQGTPQLMLWSSNHTGEAPSDIQPDDYLTTALNKQAKKKSGDDN